MAVAWSDKQLKILRYKFTDEEIATFSKDRGHKEIDKLILEFKERDAKFRKGEIKDEN